MPGKHPFVTQLLKGFFNSRHPQPRYSGTWDVQTVLAFMVSLGPNNLLSLKLLSQKFRVLLGLNSMERVSGIVAHDLPELTKKSRFQNCPQTSFHAVFQAILTCVWLNVCRNMRPELGTFVLPQTVPIQTNYCFLIFVPINLFPHKP